MLVSSKWQSMWMESQNCANSVVNISLPSQQAEKILEDVRLNCTSPNKGVQLEALKCWGSWINNQKPDDWKLNSVCYTAIRPLLMKKLQPLHKDVDVCKLKLSLMWKLLRKVQHMMQLEGPQYILDVFLQSCLMWLSSSDGVDNEISILIFQLFLSLFKKSDELIKCDKEMFPPLTESILESKKAFQRHVDKFLNVVVRWRKLKDKTLHLVFWKCFLEHCERFCDNIPVRIWHEVFKTVGQICSETSYSLKERLAFLHGCATTLDSVLSSSKFIDFGNLLTTPCEALLKKLLDLSVGTTGEEEEGVQCEREVFDADMFVMSRDVCQVLSLKSILVVSGYDLCNYVLDGLEDSSLKSMFWGIWCGLVHCYKTQLSNVDRNKLTKTEIKFYRRLRGVAVNFELDRQDIEKDCALEVERHIQVLNIGCFCNSKANLKSEKPEPEFESMDVVEVNTCRRDPPEDPVLGSFSTVVIYNPKTGPPSTAKFLTLNFNVVKDVLKTVSVLNGKSLLEGLFGFRFLSLTKAQGHEMVVRQPAIGFRKETMARDSKKPSSKLWYSVTRLPKGKPREKPRERKEKGVNNRKEEVREDKSQKVKRKREEEVKEDQPKRRSKRMAEVEEERKRKESIGCRTRRKSFEVLVQEIVKKNKLRKTEKSVRRKSPVMVGKREEVTRGKKETKDGVKKIKKEDKDGVEKRVLRENKATKVETPKTEKGAKVGKMKEIRKDGKLENYFKVLRKTKTRSERKKEEEEQGEEETGKSKRKKRAGSEKEESDKKVETGWKQTSLRSIMKPKKDEKGKQNKEVKDKTPEKKKKGKKEVVNKPEEQSLKNMSPFKEVLHDHEYAKTMEPEYLPGSKRIVMRRHLVPEKVVHDIDKKLEVVGRESVEKDEKKVDSPVESIATQEESPTLVVEAEHPTVEFPVISPTPTEGELTQKTEETNKIEGGVTKDEVKPLQEVEELSNDGKNRKRKRILMMEPSYKRQKVEEDAKEEETALEVIEKENMDVINLENKPEVNVTPTKEGILSEKTIHSNSRTVSSDMSPITSRALRMIALLPETTKGGGQVHRDSTSPKTETKSVKGTNVNVDKSSRASKMLALISENVAEPMDWNEDVVSEPPAKPSVTTPVSIFNSPKGVKKRKSIRFDEAKNETFMYQIGTPPSQIWKQCDG